MKFGSDRRTTTKQGLTVVLVSHSMEDIARLVDRLIIMYQGQVVATGGSHGSYSSKLMSLKNWAWAFPPDHRVHAPIAPGLPPPGEHRHFDCG